MSSEAETQTTVVDPEDETPGGEAAETAADAAYPTPDEWAVIQQFLPADFNSLSPEEEAQAMKAARERAQAAGLLEVDQVIAAEAGEDEDEWDDEEDTDDEDWDDEEDEDACGEDQGGCVDDEDEVDEEVGTGFGTTDGDDLDDEEQLAVDPDLDGDDEDDEDESEDDEDTDE